MPKRSVLSFQAGSFLWTVTTFTPAFACHKWSKCPESQKLTPGRMLGVTAAVPRAVPAASAPPSLLLEQCQKPRLAAALWHCRHSANGAPEQKAEGVPGRLRVPPCLHSCKPYAVHSASAAAKQLVCVPTWPGSHLHSQTVPPGTDLVTVLGFDSIRYSQLFPAA